MDPKAGFMLTEEGTHFVLLLVIHNVHCIWIIRQGTLDVSSWRILCYTLDTVVIERGGTSGIRDSCGDDIFRSVLYRLFLVNFIRRKLQMFEGPCPLTALFSFSGGLGDFSECCFANNVLAAAVADCSVVGDKGVGLFLLGDLSVLSNGL